jgi:hypothetical protein
MAVKKTEPRRRRLSMRSRTIATTAALAVSALMSAGPAAHAACPEEPCNAPAPDPTYPFVCVVTYDGPLKGITSCFDPRP